MRGHAGSLITSYTVGLSASFLSHCCDSIECIHGYPIEYGADEEECLPEEEEREACVG